MKHLKDATLKIENGDAKEALNIIEGVLAFSPRNPEAKRLKAKVLDAWGHFEESLYILKKMHIDQNITEEGSEDLEKILREESETAIFSEVTPEGRRYFALPKAQVSVSLFGLAGCAIFIFMSAFVIQNPQELLWMHVGLFFIFVIFPWVILMRILVSAPRQITIGVQGLTIHKMFKIDHILWEDIHCGVVEYDNNIQLDHLFFHLYKESSKEPVISLDLSFQGSVVRARRHFMRNLACRLQTIVWKDRSLQHDKVDNNTSDEISNEKKSA